MTAQKSQTGPAAANILTEPIDIGDEGFCTTPMLRAILEEFRASMNGLEHESLEELLEYYNMHRDDKGLAPLDGSLLRPEDRIRTGT